MEKMHRILVLYNFARPLGRDSSEADIKRLEEVGARVEALFIDSGAALSTVQGIARIGITKHDQSELWRRLGTGMLRNENFSIVDVERVISTHPAVESLTKRTLWQQHQGGPSDQTD